MIVPTVETVLRDGLPQFHMIPNKGVLRLKSGPKVDGRRPLSSPDDVASLAFQIGMHEMADEYVFALYLNTRCRIIGISEIAHGCENLCQVSLRNILRQALWSGASHQILLHNHPSGTINPSGEDIQITKKLQQAADLIEIPLLDHIIVTSEMTYSSMKEMGYLLD